jgi:D-lactate dehydrogenase
VRAGMILGHVNALRGRHGRRLGPDPASSHACTVGGMIANNAGGMCCTVERDAYHTVIALTFVTPSGAVIDTSAPGAEGTFAAAEPQLAQGLFELHRELLADPALADRTRRKYKIRNTHGYRLCALLDGETPLEIFRRLIVGSEGTLGMALRFLPHFLVYSRLNTWTRGREMPGAARETFHAWWTRNRGRGGAHGAHR